MYVCMYVCVYIYIYISTKAKVTVIYFHGNAEDLMDIEPDLKARTLCDQCPHLYFLHFLRPHFLEDSLHLFWNQNL